MPCSACLAESGCCETLQCLGGRGHTHTYKHDKWRYVHLFTGNMSSVSDMSPVDYAIRCSQFLVFYSIKLGTRSLLTLVYSSLMHTLSHTHMYAYTHTHMHPLFMRSCMHTHAHSNARTHTHTRTHTSLQLLTHTHTHTSHTQCHACMLTHACTLTLPHTRIHACTHTCTLTRSCMFTHAHMHMHTLMILTVTSPSPHQ